MTVAWIIAVISAVTLAFTACYWGRRFLDAEFCALDAEFCAVQLWHVASTNHPKGHA